MGAQGHTWAILGLAPPQDNIEMQNLSKAPEAAHCPAPMVTQRFTFHSSLHFNAGRDSLPCFSAPVTHGDLRLAVGKAVPGAGLCQDRGDLSLLNGAAVKTKTK